jgi:hypothetical protein
MVAYTEHLCFVIAIAKLPLIANKNVFLSERFAEKKRLKHGLEIVQHILVKGYFVT